MAWATHALELACMLMMLETGVKHVCHPSALVLLDGLRQHTYRKSDLCFTLK